MTYFATSTSKKKKVLKSGGNILDDWTFTEYDTVIQLNSYVGTDTDVVVPSEFVGKEGKEVTFVSYFRFPNTTTSVSIGEAGAASVRLPVNSGSMFQSFSLDDPDTELNGGEVKAKIVAVEDTENASSTEKTK